MPIEVVDPARYPETADLSVLKNYFAILQEKQKPLFKQNKSKLRKAADTLMAGLKKCTLCAWQCKVNRLSAQKGVCQLTDKMIIASYFEHLGEEEFFVPSFTIFFWSCNFKCQYCQNWTISQRIEAGKEMTPVELARITDTYSSCRNINLVGGEPTPQLPFITRFLSLVKINLPVIWNSNFYFSPSTLETLRLFVDVYLPDIKYGNDRCAEKLSKVKNYCSVVYDNIINAAKTEHSDMVIRHLVLPGHIDCCTKPILRFIADNLGRKVIVNIMDQYYPHYLASNFPEINRKLTMRELEEVIEYAKELNLNFIL